MNNINAAIIREQKKIQGIEARIKKLEIKIESNPHKKTLEGFASADSVVSRSFIDVFSMPEAKFRRSLLRRWDWEKRKNPLHDSHVRAYYEALTSTNRSIYSCPRCAREMRFDKRPRDLSGALLRHCGCRTGKGGRTRTVSAEHRILHDRVSRALWLQMKGRKSRSKWNSILGYSVHDLAEHLQRMLPRGYTLERCIKEQWHIDHIVPKSTFDISTLDGLRACWALSNLRILPAIENLRKQAKRLFLL